MIPLYASKITPRERDSLERWVDLLAFASVMGVVRVCFSELCSEQRELILHLPHLGAMFADGCSEARPGAVFVEDGSEFALEGFLALEELNVENLEGTEIFFSTARGGGG
mmetsp:Transcript_3729/g.13248  ORF Transcript_3729/g.13248 Transcript_3729/m.13248 type:complete len:110 (-) Transcript_3729:1865-2194(-)